jgi:nucleotide-binding universal stress UspA family protein
MQDVERSGRILVGVDASQGGRIASTWALEEAKLRNAEVLAVHAWHLPAMAYSATGYAVPYADDFVAEGMAQIDEVIGKLAAQDIKVEPRVVEGPPAQVLAHEAEQPDVELVVVGSRGHGGVTGLLLGSVSQALSHKCPKPLVIVPQAASVETRGRIVVGIDGSSDADRALRWAAREARGRGATLQVVLVCSDAKFDRYIDESGAHSAVAAGQEIVDAAVVALGPTGVTIERSSVKGHPAQVLVDAAASADLLVVGTRGLGRARGAIQGSVSHACAHRSPVPVAIIPYHN